MRRFTALLVFPKPEYVPSPSEACPKAGSFCPGPCPVGAVDGVGLPAPSAVQPCKPALVPVSVARCGRSRGPGQLGLPLPALKSAHAGPVRIHSRFCGAILSRSGEAFCLHRGALSWERLLPVSDRDAHVTMPHAAKH